MSHRIARPLANTAVVLIAAVALSACSGDSTTDGDEAAATSSSSDAAAATSAGPGQAAEAPVADVADLPDVVATVNDEEITREDFVTAYEPQFQQAAAQAQQAGSEVDQADLKKQTAEFMVNNLLLFQASDEAGVKVSTEDVDANIEELAAGSGVPSTEEFLTSLEEQGFTEDEVRTEVSKQLKIEKFLTQEADVKKPSEQETRDLYDELSAQQEGQGEDAAAATIPPFEQVQEELEQQLQGEAESAAADKILEDLRSKADINVAL